MEKSSFFNALITGLDESGMPKSDRSYKAESFAEYFSSFIGNGVFPNPAIGLQVVAVDNNMDIRIKAGKAWINGYYYANTDDCIHTIEVADSLLSRIDRVVLRLDFINREIKSYVKKGAFASNPVASVLQRDADMYEICLAEIKVNNGAIKISQIDITDTRLDNSLCGIVHGTVNQVDTTEIFRQFQAWYIKTKSEYDLDFTNWTTEKKEAFNIWYKENITEFLNRFNMWFTTNTNTYSNEWQAWFNGVRDTLTTDIAGNLYNQIQTLSQDLGDKSLLKTVNKKDAVSAVNEIVDEVKLQKSDIKNLNISDELVRQEILDIRLKLEENNILDFLDKTGIGFYDLFKNMENIDISNTTAMVNNVSTDVIFTNSQKLKFNTQNFANIKDIEVALYDKTREKVEVIVGAKNTNEIQVMLPPDSKEINDIFFFNGEEFKINAITRI